MASHCAGVGVASGDVSLYSIPVWCCGRNAACQIWKSRVKRRLLARNGLALLHGARRVRSQHAACVGFGARLQSGCDAPPFKTSKTGRRREYSPPSRAADALLPQGLFPLKRSIFWAYYRPGRRYLNRRNLPSSPWRRLLAGFVNFRRLIKPVGQNHRRCAKSVKSAGVPRASATFCRRAFLIFRVLRA